MERKKIKIPVRGIKEWQFVYGENVGHKKIGSAPGQDIEEGQIVDEDGYIMHDFWAYRETKAFDDGWSIVD
jgi:uncharacterized sporulation protein YeaH/YhbH (DUF444 family)